MTRWPLTQLPFALLLSTRTCPSGSSTIRAWCRETAWSSRTRPFSLPRPIRTSFPASGMVWSFRAGSGDSRTFRKAIDFASLKFSGFPGMMDQNPAKRKDGPDAVGQNRPMKARLPRLALLAATLAALLLPAAPGPFRGRPTARPRPASSASPTSGATPSSSSTPGTSGAPRPPAARPSASRRTPGLELFPKLSHDGKWIAFSAEYTGTRQVWVMPAWGGPPRQLTFATDVGPLPPRGGWDNWVLGWTRDGKVLVRMNRVPWSYRMGRYYLVDPKGGLETPLEIPEGGAPPSRPTGRSSPTAPSTGSSGPGNGRRGPGAGRLALRLRGEEVGAAHDLGRDRQLPDVVGRRRLLHLRPREDAEPLAPRPEDEGDAEAHLLHRVRRPLAEPRRREDRLHERRVPLHPRPRDGEGLPDPDHARLRPRRHGPRLPRRLAERRRGGPLAERRARRPRRPRRPLLRPGEGRRDAEPDGDARRPRARPGLVARREVDRLPLRRDGRVRALDPPAGRLGRAAPPHDRRRARGSYAPVFSPDGKKIAWGDRSQRLRVVDVATGEGDGRRPERLRGHRRLLLLPRLPLARLREEPPDPPPGPLGPLARGEEVLPARRRPDGRLLARLLGRRQVPLLPLQPRLRPGLQRLRVLLRLPEGDARLRGRPDPRRPAPLPAEERRGEGEGGGAPPKDDPKAAGEGRRTTDGRRPRRSETPEKDASGARRDRRRRLRRPDRRPPGGEGRRDPLPLRHGRRRLLPPGRRRERGALPVRPRRSGRRRRSSTASPPTASRPTGRSSSGTPGRTGASATPGRASRPAPGSSTSPASA